VHSLYVGCILSNRLRFFHREVELSYWRLSSLSVDHTISFGGAISLVGQVNIRLGSFSYLAELYSSFVAKSMSKRNDLPVVAYCAIEGRVWVLLEK
jgi:hypothetical protein